MILFNPDNAKKCFYNYAKALESGNDERIRAVRTEITRISNIYNNNTDLDKNIKLCLNNLCKSKVATRKIIGQYALHKIESNEANNKKVTRCFPFNLPGKICGKVCKKYTPVHEDHFEIRKASNSKPFYVINVPTYVSENHPETMDAINRLLCIIRDEAFGIFSEESKFVSKKRIIIVMGFNRQKSLDKRLNRTFKDFVHGFRAPDEVNVKALGFLWEYRFAHNRRIKQVRPYFQLLEKLDPAASLEVLKKIEKPGGKVMKMRIPFQEIRETIKNSDQTREAIELFRTASAINKIYLSLFDRDAKSLRSNLGLFSIYDQIIDRKSPVIASTGYGVSNEEPFLVWHGVEIDRRIREALGFVAYFPEPNTIIAFDSSDSIPETFCDTSKFGRLESRRIIQNIVEKRKLTPKDTILFSAESQLITSTAPDFYSVNNRRGVTLESFGTEKDLKALRGVRQSHLMPLSWAENVCEWLSVKNKASVRKETSVIFKLFDPVSLCLDKVLSPHVKIYSKEVHFDSVIAHYKVYLKGLSEIYPFIMEHGTNKDDFFNNDKVQNLINTYEDVEFHYENQIEVFYTTISNLLNLDLTYEDINLLVEKSIASGNAVHGYLKNMK